jgi:hypothetical protein
MFTRALNCLGLDDRQGFRRITDNREEGNFKPDMIGISQQTFKQQPGLIQLFEKCQTQRVNA